MKTLDEDQTIDKTFFKQNDALNPSLESEKINNRSLYHLKIDLNNL